MSARRSVVAVVAMSVVLGALGAPATLRALRQSAVLTCGFIYESAPFPSCHASTIVETPEGLVAAWFGGTAERNPDVGIWISRHAGGTWTTPVEVANGVQSPALRHPTWNPVLFGPAKGPLLLFYKVGPSPSTWWGMVMASTDHGRTWGAPRRLPDGILGPIKNKPVQLANGDIIAGSSTEHDGWRVHMERSTDQGVTWTATPALNDGRQMGAIQPSILVHPKGRLQAIGRSRTSGRIFDMWSDDAGRTWSPLAMTDLPNPNAGIDAVTLADGRHLVVYNHTPKGRSPLNVAISSDGRRWEAGLVIEDEPGREFSYPAVIQTRDGLVHITYTWRRERIRHVVIDPARLQPRPIADGAWPR
jgi:predicted neuraminidase